MTANFENSAKSNQPRRKFDKQQMITSVGIALGLVMIIFGFRASQTGRDESGLPDAVERMSPADGDRVLRQSQIIVDFFEGYEAVLFIDGIELPTTRLDELTSGGQQAAPGAQVELPPTAVFDPGNFIISFQPQVGAVIEELTQGEHQGKVLYWQITEGREKSRVYTWKFVTD
ncbi:MAG: hypothetical protein O2841_04310 [Actinomycetota bacterium]|nr:hypothetical protein [Actinomycetota bacterium]